MIWHCLTQTDVSGGECHLNKLKTRDMLISWEGRKQLAEPGEMSLLSNNRTYDNTTVSEKSCEADCMPNYFVALGEKVKNRILVFGVVIDWILSSITRKR